MAAPVIIRVGCAIDTSVEKTFGDIERRAVRAGKRVEQAMRPGRRRVLDDGFIQQAVSQEKRHTAAVEGESKQRQRAFRAEARARRAALRDEERALRDSIREHEKAERAKAKAAAAAVREQVRASRELDRFATRTSHRATRFFWPNAPLASMARRAGHDIMRGIGVDTTIAGAFGRTTALEKSSAALSTAGYLPGTAGPNGTRRTTAELAGEARSLGMKYGINAEDINSARDAYVALTGDLDAARKSTEEFIRVSIASGATLDDVAKMAGEQANALGDMDAEQKRAAVSGLLRAAGSGGKIGSVEAKDFAKYYAYIGGSATQFGGDSSQVQRELMAIVQLARKSGGATGAAQATRAIAGMTNTLSTPARVAMFEKYGVKLREGNLLRSPAALLRESLAAAGGDQIKLKEMFANVIGAKTIQGAAGVYNRAGGGEKGLAAFDAFFKEQADAASFTDKAMAEAVAVHLETTTAKAERFQAKLDALASAAGEKLIPALEKLEPLALRGAEALSKIVQWAAENPGKAIVGAIVASILRASLESAFRGAVEAVILRAVRNVPTIPIPGGKPGVAPVGAPGGSTATGPATALALLGVGGLLYELSALSGNRKGGPNQVGASDPFGGTVDFLTGGFVGAAARKMGGGSWADAAGELSGNKVFSWLHDLVRDPTGEKGANAQAKREAAERQAAQDRAAIAAEATRDRLNLPLTVNVANFNDMPSGGGPRVDPGGREPPGS